MPLSPAKKLLLILALCTVFGLVLAVGSIFGAFWWYARDLRDIDEDALRNHRAPQVTRILSRDGELIGEIFTERRTFIPYEEIPSHVENAFLAAEDADFYRHEGMDVLGMVRALVVNLRAGEVRQGASTITQQVVKIFLLSPERTFERKLHELILARRLEQGLSKREILQLYLNEIYLGHGRYGIEEASWFYFGKSVRDIDVGQAALLATLPKATSRDSPIRNPERARQRRRWVLEQMVSHGLAPAASVAPHLEAGLGLVRDADRVRVAAGAEEFVDEVRNQLEAEYGTEALMRLGATVHTTVSLTAQQAARATVRKALGELDVRQGHAHGLKPARAKRRAEAMARGEAPLAVGEAVLALVEATTSHPALPPEGFAAKVGTRDVFVTVPAGSRYDDPKLDLATQFPVGAVLDVRIVRTAGAAADDELTLPEGWALAEIAEGPQAALVIADAATAEILAMVGGTEHSLGDFNRASRAMRQPGSAFKPFVYGAALASRQFTAATLVSDSPEIYEKWRPTNFEADVYRGDIRLREALANSVNTIAIKLADRLGVPAVQQFARAAGIRSRIPDDLSIALGTGEVTPLELLEGYLTLARGGSRLEPTMIRRIEFSDGRIVQPAREPTAAIEPEVAFVLTSMMTEVVQSGTGTRAKALGRPVAGKTGTSADHHDAWFAGFTPRTVAVAWIGFDRPRPLGKGETGGRAAAPLWVEAVAAIEAGPPVAFVPPPTVSVRRIDRATGLLARPEAEAKTTLDEVFVAGTEPVDEVSEDARPTGDVLLDLYGDATDEGVAAANAPPPTPTRPEDRPRPSLDDPD